MPEHVGIFESVGTQQFRQHKNKQVRGASWRIAYGLLVKRHKIDKNSCNASHLLPKHA